jgi:cell wall-associated NlpC family hydrolase
VNRPGLNGIAVTTIVTGTVIMISAIKNATIADTVRGLVRGEEIKSQPSQLDAVRRSISKITDRSGGNPDGQSLEAGPGGTAMGTQVAAAAESFVGQVPYKWAGEDPVNGWDCSGFVTYVLHHIFGIELPSNVHTVAAQFLIWGGARTIPRSQCAAGDLVCWASHIGIAINNKEMVNAARPGTLTRIDNIWSAPTPTIRRPIAYGLPPTLGVGGKL